MSSPYQRLVWKEFRSLSPFWLALLIAHAVICVTLSVTFERSLPLDVALATVAIVVCAGYAVGSSVLAFSGEEDHGTALWLRMLPVKTSTVFLAKVSMIIFGTAVLVLACFAVNAPINLLWSGVSRTSPRGSSPVEFTLFALAGLTGFTGCLLLSLRSRRVIPAFGWTTLLLVVLFALTAVALDRHSVAQANVVLATASAISLGLVLRQARIWHLRPNRPWMQTARGVVSSYFTLPATAGRRQDKLSGQWLSWAAARPSLSSRSTAVLCWQEGRSACRFAAFCLVGSLLLFLAQEVPHSYLVPTELLVLVIVMEAGLRTFRGDQRRLNGLFWSHRGVSPLRVWMVRNAVWLLTLLLTLTGLFALEFLVKAAFSPNRGHNVWFRLGQENRLFAKSLFDSAAIMSDTTLETVGWVIYQILTWVVGIFAVCQLCSCWIRKPLVATFAAMLVMTMMIAWLVYLHIYGLPLLLVAWPLILCIGVAVPLTRQQWMDRRTGFLLHTVRWTSIAGPVLGVCLLGQVWWAYQVPSRMPASSLMNAAAHADFHESFGYSNANGTGAWAEAWSGMERKTSSGVQMTAVEDDPALHEAELASRSEAVQAIDRVVAMLDEEPRQLPTSRRIPGAWIHRTAANVTSILLDEADRLQEKGEITEAFGRLVDSVRFNRFLMSQSTTWSMWEGCLHFERQALRGIRDAVAADSVAGEQLGVLRKNLAALGLHDDFEVVLVNRYVVLDQLLQRRGYLWDWYQRHSDEVEFEVDFRTLSWAERHRQRRFNDLLSDTRVRLTQDQIHRWIAFDPTAQELFGGAVPYGNTPLRHSDSWRFEQYQSLLADRRATRTVIALQQYRRRHGVFPDTLSDLIDVGIEEDEECLRDPWLDVEFGFAADGYGQTVAMLDLEAGVQFLASDQPVLWCRGPAEPVARRQFIKPVRLPERPASARQVIFLGGFGTRFAGTHDFSIRNAIDYALSERPRPAGGSHEFPADFSGLSPVDE